MLFLSLRGLPIAVYALIAFGYPFSFSFTITHVIGRQRGTHFEHRGLPPLTMKTSTAQPSFDRDLAIIKSVTAARTAKELSETLLWTVLPGGPVERAESIQSNYTVMEDAIKVFPHFSINVLAAALRHLALISVRGRNVDDEMQKQFIASLLETIGKEFAVAQRGHGSLGVYALADVLQALAILSSTDIYADASDWESRAMVLDNLSDLAIEMLSRHDVSEIKRLGPIRLLQCLQAMAKLGTVETPFHFLIYEQLLKPNSSSRIPAKYLAHGLDALSTVVNNRADSCETLDGNLLGTTRSSETALLARAFMRRLRKEKVREEATIDDLCRALLATDDLWHSGGLKDLEEEAAIFGFTVLQAILQKKKENDVKINPGQMATMVSSWATLTNNAKRDTIIDELLCLCVGDVVLERSSIFELERIISSIQQLRIANHADIMRIAGDRLVCLATEGKIVPKAFNSILRCPVLLYRRDSLVMNPYIQACEKAFLDKAFLAKCNVSEIANFLWFASIARWRHESALEALGQRILDPELCDKCTPKLASRILATYTSILSLPKNVAETSSIKDDFVRGLTSQLFHNYGGHLLTSKLSPAEVSSALYAYAKASYFYDMGIFDHLVSLMADMSCSREAPAVRQMTQSLWSCGKMSVWETGGDTETDNPDEYCTKGAKAPCLESAYRIADALSARAHELSPVDVAQCIWALGRLGSPNEGIVVSFASRAGDLAKDMNAVEVSNILWGLSRINFFDDSLVNKLTERLTSNGVMLSPKEAAMALYALARLGVGDEDVYANLSGLMIEKIDETSAQAVANTLWAYRTVRLQPPEQLLNVWAAQKLGLASVRSIDIGI